MGSTPNTGTLALDELIGEMDSGQFNTEASRELRDLVDCLQKRAATAGSAKGELTLKIKLDAAGNGRLELAADITVKRPGPPRVQETRWAGKGGAMHTADPRQEHLPLQSPTPSKAH